jgi:nicotinic acid mononucleotide adenylyltransferase
VAARPDDGGSERPVAGGSSPDGARRIPGPGLAVSATEIRQRVKEGLSIRYLVPETVADYIAKRGLYR